VSLPIDNGAEPFRGCEVLAQLPAQLIPRDLELYVRGAAQRTQRTWVIWFDTECAEWAFLPANDSMAPWEGVTHIEPHNQWHRSAA
jgi:uncharacterized protein YecT (DUF1311 family)